MAPKVLNNIAHGATAQTVCVYMHGRSVSFGVCHNVEHSIALHTCSFLGTASSRVPSLLLSNAATVGSGGGSVRSWYIGHAHRITAVHSGNLGSVSASKL
jgi:hypothetical protein